MPSSETTVKEIARNAGTDTVDGLTEPPREIVNVAGTRALAEPPAGFLALVPCDPPPDGGWGEAPPDAGPVVVVACGAVVVRRVEVACSPVLVLGGDVRVFVVEGVEVEVGVEVDVELVVAVDSVEAAELPEALEACFEPPHPAISTATTRATQIIIGRLIAPA